MELQESWIYLLLEYIRFPSWGKVFAFLPIENVRLSTDMGIFLFSRLVTSVFFYTLLIELPNFDFFVFPLLVNILDLPFSENQVILPLNGNPGFPY